ncbi:MAG: hypothetical protein WB870_02140 [Gallionellaceae bacterium]
MKTRHLLMLGGLAGAAWLAFFGDKSANTEVAEPVARQSAMPPSSPPEPDSEGAIGNSTPTGAESQNVQGEAEVRILELQPRAELIGAASSGQGSEGLFSGKSWTPLPKLGKLDEMVPPPPPAAPPLPFTYLGKQTAGGQTQVYLARGDKVFVVRDRTVIQNIYRVESIKPPTLSLVYLPLNQIQQLSIGVAN